MKTETEEAFVALLLKGLAAMSLLAAVVYFCKGLAAPPTMRLSQVAVAQSRDYSMAIVTAGGAVGLWWMAAILSLLDRIARNGKRLTNE